MGLQTQGVTVHREPMKRQRAEMPDLWGGNGVPRKHWINNQSASIAETVSCCETKPRNVRVSETLSSSPPCRKFLISPRFVSLRAE